MHTPVRRYIFCWEVSIFLNGPFSLPYGRPHELQSTCIYLKRTTTRFNQTEGNRLNLLRRFNYGNKNGGMTLNSWSCHWTTFVDPFVTAKQHSEFRQFKQKNHNACQEERRTLTLEIQKHATYKRYRKLFDLKKFIIFFLIFSLLNVPWNSEPYLSNFHFCRAHFCQSSKDESCSNSLSAISLLFLV